MADWTPERLRALDRAVALARGWARSDERMPDPDAYDYVWLGWRKPDGMPSVLEPVSLGCRETFELQEEEQIDTGWTINDEPAAWVPRREISNIKGPTIPICICLAYLAAKGVPFNG